ncbi:MAG: hypothetical protein WDN44_02850 [Sphingomonas sp.]
MPDTPEIPPAPPPAPAPVPVPVRWHLGQMSRWIHWIGGLGLVALVGALVAMALFRADSHSAGCPRQGGPATTDSFRIVDVVPSELRLGGHVCVVVENVVTAQELAAADAVAQSALNEINDAHAQKARMDDAALAGAAADSNAAIKAEILKNRLADAQDRLAKARAAAALLRQPRMFVLYLNGRPAPFDKAPAVAQPGQQVLDFALSYSADANSEMSQFWRGALAAPIEDGRLTTQVSLGLEGATTAVPLADGNSVARHILLYEAGVRWAALLGMACLLIWVVTLANATPMLRSGQTADTAFSLSRVQMAFWFVLVTAGFIYIWIVTGQYLDVIHTSTFALLGISGAAAGAAQSIDATEANAAPPSRGFLPDLLSDSAGHIQLHRLQMFAWTLILGGIFFWSFAANLQLADFDSNLLVLSGIVSGIYVGLKTQE